MDMRVAPLKLTILHESNPLRSRISVWRSAVRAQSCDQGREKPNPIDQHTAWNMQDYSSAGCASSRGYHPAAEPSSFINNDKDQGLRNSPWWTTGLCSTHEFASALIVFSFFLTLALRSSHATGSKSSAGCYHCARGCYPAAEIGVLRNVVPCGPLGT